MLSDLSQPAPQPVVLRDRTGLAVRPALVVGRPHQAAQRGPGRRPDRRAPGGELDREHTWEQTPCTSDDTTPIDPDQEIGATITGDNPYSYYEGARTGIGPTCHDEAVLLHGAGGIFGIAGEYMFRDFQRFHLDGGMWGLLRVSGISLGESIP